MLPNMSWAEPIGAKSFYRSWVECPRGQIAQARGVSQQESLFNLSKEGNHEHVAS